MRVAEFTFMLPEFTFILPKFTFMLLNLSFGMLKLRSVIACAFVSAEVLPCFSSFAEVLRRQSRLLLEERAEVRGIGKVEIVGNLLNAL